MSDEIFNRKVDSFKKVLSGSTYQSLGNEYGVSRSIIRQDVMWLMRYIRRRLECPPELKDWEITKARVNKSLWLESLDKALKVVKPHEQDELDIKKAVDDFISKPYDQWLINCVLARLESYIKEKRISKYNHV